MPAVDPTVNYEDTLMAYPAESDLGESDDSSSPVDEGITDLDHHFLVRSTGSLQHMKSVVGTVHEMEHGYWLERLE